MSYNTKNYFAHGGEELVIGGKLTILEGATVTGLEGGSGSAYELPTASASTLGGVKVGAGLAINDGVLSVPAATSEAIGGIKVGSGLTITDGVLSADGITPAAYIADSDASSYTQLKEQFNALLAALRAAGLMVATAPESSGGGDG